MILDAFFAEVEESDNTSIHILHAFSMNGETNKKYWKNQHEIDVGTFATTLNQDQKLLARGKKGCGVKPVLLYPVTKVS